jgi:hypothetical protein
MSKGPAVAVLALASVLVSHTAFTGQPSTSATLDITQLWSEPGDLSKMDLVAGPGGATLQPTSGGTFTFVAHKTSGVNPGYDVRDGAGRLWSVKLGEEAQAEVAVSRILWAMGYHQPAVYYVPEWTLTGTDAGVKGGGRFRTDVPPWESTGEWDWYENPFIDTEPFRGLVVAQMLLANWDLKASNNRLYQSADPSASPRRRYVVRDLGSSLGSARQHRFFAWIGTRGQQGTKNDIEGFERRGFITEIHGVRVEFDYRGLNEELTTIVTPADVVWACERLARLTDGQWQDVFRAGGYAPEIAARFVTKIKQKIGQGLALRSTTR